jgi:preprotein translocase subunit SecE
MKKIKGFFLDVKKEISKVKWPSKKDMVKYSITTITFVAFFALFFLGLDLINAYIRTIGA